MTLIGDLFEKSDFNRILPIHFGQKAVFIDVINFISDFSSNEPKLCLLKIRTLGL